MYFEWIESINAFDNYLRTYLADDTVFGQPRTSLDLGEGRRDVELERTQKRKRWSP
jgi:hypothetical protein